MSRSSRERWRARIRRDGRSPAQGEGLTRAQSARRWPSGWACRRALSRRSRRGARSRRSTRSMRSRPSSGSPSTSCSSWNAAAGRRRAVVAAWRPAPDRPRRLPAGPVQRGRNRKSIRLASGVVWERLTSESIPSVDFLYVTYEVGGESSPEQTRSSATAARNGAMSSAARLEVTDRLRRARPPAGRRDQRSTPADAAPAVQCR